MKKIFVVPSGGLGNRLRVLIASMVYAGVANREVILDWGDGYKFYESEFNNLFEPVDGVTLDKIHVNRDNVHMYVHQNGVKQFNNVLPLHNDIENIGIKTGTLGKHKDIDLSYFRDEFHRIWNTFKPAKKIEERIVSFDGEEVFGAHIRRSDQVVSTRVSTDKLFVDCISKELSTGKKKVFISTCDKKTLHKFINIFKDKVICYNDTDYNRDTAKNAHDAVRDLFTYKQCHKVYGSHYSSYTDMIGNFYDVELVVVGK
jgi:hypothetical protein